MARRTIKVQGQERAKLERAAEEAEKVARATRSTPCSDPVERRGRRTSGWQTSSARAVRGEESTTLATSLHATIHHLRKVLSESTTRIAELECKDEMARDVVRDLERDLRLKDVEASSFKL